MSTRTAVIYQVLELGGVRYAVLPERSLVQLCDRAGFRAETMPAAEPVAGDEWDPQRIAQHLIRRREQHGLSQAELARRAGIRVETLNRIEKGRTTPDFSTLRKIMAAFKVPLKG
jgi:DNA-binding XRE family transcriptional regulator